MIIKLWFLGGGSLMQSKVYQKRKPGWRGLWAGIAGVFSWSNDQLERQRNPGLLENLEMACREWKYAKLYFNCVIDPDLIDHAIYYLDATEKKYIYLLKRAREEGLYIENYRLS
jgi:hypothetical protein